MPRFQREKKKSGGISYHVHVPKFYNNKTPVEEYRFKITEEDLVSVFGGCSEIAVEKGVWKDPNTKKIYKDWNLVYEIDVYGQKKISEAETFFKFYKRILKTRFEQKEIYISANVLMGPSR